MTGDERDVLAGLDPEQRAAAEAVRGPVCILAGAGTGKTRAITHRIAHQVRSGAVPPGQLLAVTFTGHAGPLNEPAFGNAMYWSLDYEVWYYMIFAAAVFYSGRKRLLLVSALVLLSGPRVALLMSMWLLGVFIYRATQSVALERRTALTAKTKVSFPALIFQSTETPGRATCF